MTRFTPPGSEATEDVLFTMPLARGVPIVCVVLGLFLILVGLIIPENANNQPGSKPAMLAIGFGFGMPLAICGAWLLLRNRHWVFCRDAMLQVERWGQRTVRYSEISELVFSITRVFQYGIYHHTQVSMRVVAPDCSKPIVIDRVHVEKSGVLAGERERSELEDIRDRISSHIAHRMQSLIDSGQTAPWAGPLGITRDGLEVEIVNGCRERVAWGEIARAHLDAGVFQLWLKSRDKAVVSIPVGSVNFFPGYVILLSALAREEQAAQEASRPASHVADKLTAGEYLIVEFTNTTEDYKVVDAFARREASKPNEFWFAVLGILVFAVIAGIAATFVRSFHTTVSARDWFIAPACIFGFVIVGFGLVRILSLLARGYNFLQELERSHQQAVAGNGEDPFAPKRLTVSFDGIALEVAGQRGQWMWEEVSRIESVANYLLIFRAAEKVTPETLIACVPLRFFQNPEAARRFVEAARTWLEQAVGRVGRGTSP